MGRRNHAELCFEIFSLEGELCVRQGERALKNAARLQQHRSGRNLGQEQLPRTTLKQAAESIVKERLKAMAHRIFDVLSVVILLGLLLKAIRSFLVSDLVCVLGECIASEWRHLIAAHRILRRLHKEPELATANSHSLAEVKFSGD
jgi:hypothetical protein